MSLVRKCRRIPVLLLLIAAAGCSSDDPLPVCTNCESWTQVTAGLARFPDPHPTEPRWVAYSSIEKRPNAPDANRESDEDIWLTYHDRSVSLADSPKWQLTDDALGAGGNTAPRFSPSGTQIAFAHATGGGNYEIWRLPLTVPADPADPPLAGAAEIVVSDARDPAWASETRLYFVRGDKLFRVDLPAGPGAPVAPPVQLTFSPPVFASTEVYIDRHPAFSPDGGAVFNSTGRRSTADVVLKAFEVDDTVFPPDTTETRAWISYQPPGALAPTYPLFIGADTLRTPRTISSLPVGDGGIFTLGARRDSRFLPALSEAYCDTLITIPVNLQPGDVDTLKFYFHVVRGTLLIRSGIGQVSASWARQDQRESENFAIGIAGGSETFPCLMPFRVEAGQIIPGQQEPFLVRGTRGPLADSAQVVIAPGDTTTVNLFPAGRVTATLVFPGAPTPLPLAQATAVLSGTTIFISSGNSDTQTGVVTITALPAASLDIRITVPGTAYRDTTLTGVVVTPPATTDLGTIVLSTDPNEPAGARGAAIAAETPAGPEREHLVAGGGPAGASDNPADLASIFRAEGDASTVWRLQEDALGRSRLELRELFGSEFLIQHPVVTDDLGNGLRYVAYVANDTADWQLYVQRLQDWMPDGAPVQVLTPGTSDNLSCVRTVFHPRWVPGRGSGGLALLVALGDCPSNGFEGLGIDDNPWAVGEIRVWSVELGPGF